MKAVAAKLSGGITIESRIKVDDNSGAKILRVIGKEDYRGRRGRLAKIGVGEILIGAVVSGKLEMRKKRVRAVLIRQKRPYRRKNGLRVCFEDNACVLINENNEPVASEIKGVIAKEAAERFPKLASIAKNVV
ncbi:MAG: uL14 family ribosomal protein [archaeon]